MTLVTERNEWKDGNDYVTAIDGFEFMPRLDDSTQYSTVFDAATDKPLATLCRRQYLSSGPVWTLYATDGTKLREWFFAPTYAALARGVAYKISKHLGSK